MCNSQTCSHDYRNDPLNDDISDLDLFSDLGLDLNTSKSEREANIARKGDLPSSVNKTYTETCPACHNGTFYSWAGRPLGTCRKCKGTGKLTFRTSPEQRQQTKKYYRQAKQRKATEARESAEQFANDNQAEYQWLTANTGKFDFATSLFTALNKYGRLTDGQLNAVRKCIQRDEDRKAAREEQRKQLVANAPTCDVSKIEATFATAQSNGVRRPKMRLADFIFSLAPAHGANAGAIYVVERETKTYLGKIQNGKFIRVAANCTEQQAAEIAEAASDPHAAAKAYGQRFGACSICGRELTKGDSIDRMMGPICADKYGF
jgi:hypothetical protein